MIAKLLKLISTKNINSYVICLNTERFCGKIKHNDITYKVPAIKLESNKNDDLINSFIEKNNISTGAIVLNNSNLLYLPQLNLISIGFNIEKKTQLSFTFDLKDQMHLLYIAGVLLSKSLLVVNNKNLESTININFEDDNGEFTEKANQLLSILTQKVALKYLKENPKYKEYNKDQFEQLIELNPNYLNGISDEFKNTWIYTEN